MSKNKQLEAFIQRYSEDNKTKFAERIGVKRQTVYNWLNGKHYTAEGIIKIANAFKMSPQEVNSSAGFNLSVDFSSTPLEQLERRVEIIEKQLKVMSESASSIQALFVLGILHSHNLSVMDIFLNTTITQEVWQIFADHGLMDPAQYEELRSWTCQVSGYTGAFPALGESCKFTDPGNDKASNSL